MLRKNFFDPDQMAAITRDFHTAGLPDQEVAMMAFAQKVVTHSDQVSEQDFEALRLHGYSDEEILDIILASAARSFISRALDAIGAKLDLSTLGLEPELLQLLNIGRQIS